MHNVVCCANVVIFNIFKTGGGKALMNKRKTYEYKNDFLYFVLRPDESRGKGILVYCSGVNISRFLSITREHRMAANPAFRGLQTLNLEIRALILSKGATPQTIKGNDCAGISTTKDRWNTELILIENASESLPDEIINYSVINLIKKIIHSSLSEVKPPEKLLKPDELQMFIENLCSKYGS